MTDLKQEINEAQNFPALKAMMVKLLERLEVHEKTCCQNQPQPKKAA